MDRGPGNTAPRSTGSTPPSTHITNNPGEATYGYGLACYAWLRGEGWPGWMDYLDGSPRATMRDGLQYLEKVAEPGQLGST